MVGKRPSFQFYPGDWMKDPALRSCSVAARGLWLDMLCLMFEGDRKGYLCVNGKPVSAEQIARMTGCDTTQVSQLLTELESSGVFSRTEHGMIYSRRMTRDESKRQKCAEAGKLGGNPTLKGHSKGDPKGTPKGGANRNPTPSSSSSSSSSEEKKEEQLPSVTVAAPKPKPSPKPRERNPLFDAIAEVTGVDPRTAGSLVGAVSSALAGAEPPYTTGDVREFAGRFWEFCPWAAQDGRQRPTPKELQTYIGKLRAAPAPTQSAPARGGGGLFDHAAKTEARIVAQASEALRAP